MTRKLQYSNRAFLAKDMDEEEEEDEIEDDDSESENAYQATDIDDFHEDRIEAKPLDGPFPQAISINISIRTLMHIFVGLSIFSSVAVLIMAMMTTKRFERMERKVDDIIFDLNTLNNVANGLSNRPATTVCESCKNKEKDQQQKDGNNGNGNNNSMIEDWISMMKEHVSSGDTQNQRVPRMNRIVDLGSPSVNELYKVKRDITGKVIDVTKHGSYIR